MNWECLEHSFLYIAPGCFINVSKFSSLWHGNYGSNSHGTVKEIMLKFYKNEKGYLVPEIKYTRRKMCELSIAWRIFASLMHPASALDDPLLGDHLPADPSSSFAPSDMGSWGSGSAGRDITPYRGHDAGCAECTSSPFRFCDHKISPSRSFESR